MPNDPSIEEKLFRDGCDFDFFQAVRVLQKLRPESVPVGRGGPPNVEIVRFRAHVSTSFPPSAIYDVVKPGGSTPVPVMTIAFFGVTGPSGVLPRHYTELLLKIARESKGREKYALRDWYDLFNHRLISLFYRAWEKYRFFVSYERGDYKKLDPDPFTRSLRALIGLEAPTLRDRLHLVERDLDVYGDEPPRVLAKIDDINLLFYAGLLSNRTRNASGLRAILADFFGLAVEIKQFQGQWLLLEKSNQSSIGDLDGNNQLGVNLVAGEKVWDVQGKIRVRIGPLSRERFLDFVPNTSDVHRHNDYFRVVQLIRLYLGPTIDFDLQVILKAKDVPDCELTDDPTRGPLLGWNTWIKSGDFPQDAEDAVFEGRDVYELTPSGLVI